MTFTKLDTEGKPLWICDARGNLVMQYVTPPKAPDDPSNADLHRRRSRATTSPATCSSSTAWTRATAGCWTDGAGKPMLAWDFNHRLLGDGTAIEVRRLSLAEYDALRRPVAQWLRVDDGPTPDAIERSEYSTRDEPRRQPAATRNSHRTEAANMIGELVLQYDSSGRSETARRRLQGQPCRTEAALEQPPVRIDDRLGAEPGSLPRDETFVQSTAYDALNRAVRLDVWHRVGTRTASSIAASTARADFSEARRW